MKCQDCNFVTIVDASEMGGVPMVGEKIYVCKRFPPVPVMVPVQTQQGAGMGMQTTSPVVNPNDFCFEYQGTLKSALDQAPPLS